MSGSSIEFFATGTNWKIDFSEALSPTKLAEIRNKLTERAEDFENDYSRFKDNSLISRMSKVIGEHHLPEDAEKLMNFYFKLNRVTGGKFTPLVGDLLNRAGYDKDYSFVPKGSLQHIPDLKNVCKYSFPKINIHKRYQWDFGAAGKGYLIDILKELLDDMKVVECCIDAGGDICYKSNSKSLRIGLEDPNNFENVLGVVEVLNQSLCGSSGSRRHWSRYHHILDPIALHSPNSILSTWVLADDTMTADGIATSLFFTEPDKLSKDFVFDYLILNSDYSVKKSANFLAELF